jgi:hypothetical protein
VRLLLDDEQRELSVSFGVPVRWVTAVLAVLTLGGCEPSDVIWWAFRDHPVEVREQAVEVAWCESRHVEDARSPGGHVGWFQFSRVHEGRAAALGFSWERVSTEGTVNAILAEDLYSASGGWGPWSCRPR